MRKLLVILSLCFCIKSNSQISINTAFTGYTTSTTDVSAFGHANKTYTAGRLYLFIGSTTGTANAGTISGTTSSTWTSIVDIGNSTRRIQIFRFMPSTTIVNETVNLGTFGGSSTGYTTVILEISGVDQSGTNGSGAIYQTVTGGTTGTDPSITMAATSTNNGIITFFYNDANPFGGTPESGWTEVNDDGYSTPSAGGYTMTRINTTDNTPTVTAASSTWIGAAIEIKSGLRRIIITN